MSEFNKEAFYKAVYDLVKQIPSGFVLTYGTIALLCGRPQNSRLVGKAMSQAPQEVFAYRVVNHIGRTVPDWAEQRVLLEAEEVTFKENGCVDLKKHIWRGYSTK